MGRFVAIVSARICSVQQQEAEYEKQERKLC